MSRENAWKERLVTPEQRSSWWRLMRWPKPEANADLAALNAIIAALADINLRAMEPGRRLDGATAYLSMTRTLLTKQGRHPCNPDDDAFWQAVIRLLKTLRLSFYVSIKDGADKSMTNNAIGSSLEVIYYLFRLHAERRQELPSGVIWGEGGALMQGAAELGLISTDGNGRDGLGYAIRRFFSLLTLSFICDPAHLPRQQIRWLDPWLGDYVDAVPFHLESGLIPDAERESRHPYRFAVALGAEQGPMHLGALGPDHPWWQKVRPPQPCAVFDTQGLAAALGESVRQLRDPKGLHRIHPALAALPEKHRLAFFMNVRAALLPWRRSQDRLLANHLPIRLHSDFAHSYRHFASTWTDRSDWQVNDLVPPAPEDIHWYIVDWNENGLLLRGPGSMVSLLQPGVFLGLEQLPRGEISHPDPSLTVRNLLVEVRWLRVTRQGELLMGVKRLGDNPLSVQVTPDGRKGPPCPALLARLGHREVLILPARTWSPENIIEIRLGDRQWIRKLGVVLRETPDFCQYFLQRSADGSSILAEINTG